MAEQESFDWFDSQPTPAQRQTTELDDSQTMCKLAYVAERELVSVNESNVDDLFQSLSGDDSTLIQLQNVFNTKAKSEFISHVISQEYDDELRMEELREKIFINVKSIRDFPYPNKCELKKRINSRKGDSVLQKLASDIYMLVNVLDGGSFDALKDMMSIPKNTPKRAKSVSTSFSQSDCSTFEGLRSLVTRLQADMLQLKETNVKLAETVKQDLFSVKSDLSLFRKDTNDLLDELQQTVLHHSHALERVGDERSLGIAHTKSDVKQLRSELRICNDSLELEIRRCNTNCEKGVKSLEKRIGKVEKRLRSPESVPVEMEDNPSVIMSNTVDSPPVTENEGDTDTADADISSQKSEANNICSVGSNPLHTTGRFPIAPGSSSSGQLYYTSNAQGPRFERQPDVSLRSETYSEKLRKQQNEGVPRTIRNSLNSDNSKDVCDSNKNDIGNPIEVRISRHVTDCATNEEDLSDFIQHVRKKKRFFLGGFKPSISEASIKGYMKARKGPEVISVDIIKPKFGSDVIIRLTVEANNSGMILDNKFWPDGVRCRQWYSRPKNNRQRPYYKDRNDQTTEGYARANGYRRQSRTGDSVNQVRHVYSQ